MLRDLDRSREPMFAEDAEIELAGLGSFLIRGESDDLADAVPSRRGTPLKAITMRLTTGQVAINAGAKIGVRNLLADSIGEVAVLNINLEGEASISGSGG